MSNTQSKVAHLRTETHRFKFTDRAVNALKPRSKVRTAWDEVVPNLHVIVQISGSKSFYVRKNGKKRKLGSVGIITTEEARQAARLALAEGIESSKHIGKNLNNAFDEYLKHKTLSKGFESNLKQCKRVFSKLLQKPLTSISKHDIAKSVSVAIKANGDPMADSTKDSALNVLSSVFTYQIAIDAIENNPVKNVKKRIPKLKINKRTNKLSNADDLALFTKWFLKYEGITPSNLPTGLSFRNIQEFKMTRLIGLFLLLTGCRVGEALNLKKDDICIDNKVDSKNNPIPHKLTFKETKNGSNHSLLMPNHLFLNVKRAMELTNTSNPYVFRLDNTSKGAMYARIERSLSSITINHQSLNPHDLRRTAAYLMAFSGVPQPEVAIILNHHNSSMTERYVGELTDKTFEILVKYQEYLSNLIYIDDETYRYTGLSILTGSQNDPCEVTPLKDIVERVMKQQFDFEDYYS